MKCNKLRIVILGTRGFPNIQGGVEKHCENLASYLAKMGCEVIVFTRSPYVKNSVGEYNGVKLVTLPAIRSKSLEAFFHTLIGVFATLKYKPDILHIQAIGPGLFVPLARILGMSVVLTSHGSNYKHIKWGRFAKLVLRLAEFWGVVFANKVIAVCKIIADEIKKKYRKEVTVIFNGVVIPQILVPGEVIKRFNLKPEKYILTVGRFVPEKGFSDLISAYKKSRIKGIKLVIVGNADHEDKYSKGLKEDAAGDPGIVLTGTLTGKPLWELYSNARLFVLPSYYEGLSITLLEAISYGLPVLVSDIAANREVELAENHFFRCGDVNDLKKKMEDLLYKRFSAEEKEGFRNQVAQKYNWDKIAAKTIEVYKEVLRVQT